MSISISHFLYWLAAYLAGAIPFGWIIVKIIKNKDIRYIASGRMGMSNVMRVAGTFWGIVTAVLDVLKEAEGGEAREHRSVSHLR